MTKESDNRSWFQWTLMALFTLALSFSGWTAAKVITLDKELVQLKERVSANTEKYERTENKLEEMQKEQRAILTGVIKIAAKMDVDLY